MSILYTLAVAGAAGIGVLWMALQNIRVIKQFERGVVFRFGRVQSRVRPPGLTMLVPFADRLQKVNLQIITLPVPGQDGITRDNVTVRVDAVIYFKVEDPVRAAVDVQDYMSAIGQVAQTSLRSIIGKSNLDDLLSNRERLNQGLELLIDSPALGWGIHIDRVEIKDVVLPDSMKRSIARQAEAERERRARVITADGELQASEKLAQAAAIMAVGAGGAAAAAAANRGRGRRRKELDAHPAVPGRAAALPGTVHPGPRREDRGLHQRRDAGTDRAEGARRCPRHLARRTAEATTFRAERLAPANVCGMIRVMPLHADSVSRWIDGYLRTFAACVRGDGDMASLLGHFGVPMIVTSDEGVVTLMTDGEAAAVMQSQVDSLRALGFDHSEVLNSEVIVLNAASALYRATLSRRNGDGGEIDCPTITYLVTDDVAGPRIVLLAAHSR